MKFSKSKEIVLFIIINPSQHITDYKQAIVGLGQRKHGSSEETILSRRKRGLREKSPSDWCPQLGSCTGVSVSGKKGKGKQLIMEMLLFWVWELRDSSKKVL